MMRGADVDEIELAGLTPRDEGGFTAVSLGIGELGETHQE